MKQQILNLKKKLLLVEIESFDPVKIIHEKNVSYFGQKMELIGKLTDITEEQFEKWVEQYTIDKWRNYLMQSQYHEWLKPTAKESFFSYLEKEGIYFENLLGEKPILNEDNLWGNAEQDTQVFAALNYQIDKWQEAEQKVWNKNNCYIFEII
jgi:hypothetical protein